MRRGIGDISPLMWLLIGVMLLLGILLVLLALKGKQLEIVDKIREVLG